MKKIYRILLLTGVLMLIINGCGKTKGEENQDAAKEQEEPAVMEQETVEEEPAAETETLSFAELKNQKFVFSSGAGAWGTYVRIEEDGSFTGDYQDSDMGDAEAEYPNGTVYKSVFFGEFTEPVKVSEDIYSMQIVEITYEQEPGTEIYQDGFRYVYDEAHGLKDAGEILVYRKGISLAELPETYLNWVGYYDLSETEDTVLPYWGLYNVEQEQGFSSTDVVEAAKNLVANMEERAKEAEASLQNDVMTQTDMNITSQQIYEEWDYLLNYLWGVVKETLDPDSFEELLAEQREWIAYKEAEVNEAGAEAEGGTLYGLVVNQRAAELTRERIYELLEMLEE